MVSPTFDQQALHPNTPSTTNDKNQVVSDASEPTSGPKSNIHEDDATQPRPVLTQLERLLVEAKQSLDKSIPAQKLELFRFLPTELQEDIWDLALTIPRIIEFEFPNHYEIHYHAHLKPRSRIAPAILHVCHQARQKGLSVNQHHVIKQSGKHSRHYVPRYSSRQGKRRRLQHDNFYFNPEVDILHLPLSTEYIIYNTSTHLHEELPITDFLRMAFPNFTIQRLALNSSHVFHEAFRTQTAARIIDTLHSLPQVEDDGYAGLKEILFVLKDAAGEEAYIKPKQQVLFRATNSDGHNSKQRRAKANIMEEIKKVVRGGFARWAWTNQPAFSFVSFQPVGSVSLWHDTLVVYSEELQMMQKYDEKSEKIWKELMKDCERNNVKITEKKNNERERSYLLVGKMVDVKNVKRFFRRKMGKLNKIERKLDYDTWVESFEGDEAALDWALDRFEREKQGIDRGI